MRTKARKLSLNLSGILSVSICLLFFALCVYSYLDMQNTLTELRLEIPRLAKSLKEIQQQNTHLQFEIEEFENPEHLMQLARQPAFSHLKFPLMKEVVTLQESQIALQVVDHTHLPANPLKLPSNVALASR